MKTEYKYIKFRYIEKSPSFKTEIWQCFNSRHGDWLATIGWDAQWRQYVVVEFSAYAKFSVGCLIDIADFLKQLNEKHKQNLLDKTPPSV